MQVGSTHQVTHRTLQKSALTFR